jgi:predicted DNA-binding transcriptional regulator AlpA
MIGSMKSTSVQPSATEAKMVTLGHLPPDVARRRILDTSEAAAFCRISVPHWRRLYRAGKVPKPLRLSTRKYGWRLGDLLDFIDERASMA